MFIMNSLDAIQSQARTLMNGKYYQRVYDLLYAHLDICTDPTSCSRFLTTMGNAQYWMRKNSAAKKLFRMAIDYDGQNVDARLGLAKILCVDKKFNAAAGEYRQVLLQDPSHEGAVAGLRKIADKVGAEAVLRYGLPAP